MKKFLLSSACLLAFGGVAQADQPWAASIAGDYQHSTYHLSTEPCPSEFCSLDGYNIDAAVALPWTISDFSLQLDFANHGVGAGHDTQGGGNIVWSGLPNVRIAGTAIYNWATIIDTGNVKLPEWQLGGGAEWYVNPWLTASAQGGGYAGKLDGGYFGATLKGYVCPDASLAGYVNYISISKFGISANETDFGVKGEWLVLKDSFPLSITAGYEHSQINPNFLPFDASADTFHVGLKLYLDEGMAPMTLVEHNRTGTLDTIGAITPLGFRTSL